MTEPTTLLVFSDDWGRHPSSCQHLVKEVLPRFDVCWVNTIGTRLPALDASTLARGIEKITQWARRAAPSAPHSLGASPRVLNPLMWPGFSTRLSRRLNRYLLGRALRAVLDDTHRVVAITTLPIVADLVGREPIERWVYYCVDDLSEWPGLDGATLRAMETQLVDRVDAIIAASDKLVERMAALGRHATRLTHGVDLSHWTNETSRQSDLLARCPPPRVVFWGLIDSRLDTRYLEALSDALDAGTIVLIGPEDGTSKVPVRLNNVVKVGPVAYAELPAIASAAAVLIMPYADLPVTRAMQPLKIKEYLATGRPVVSTPLPAVREWADACDLADSAEDFARRVLERIRTGLPPEQERARRRLAAETWSTKAELFERVILGAGLPAG